MRDRGAEGVAGLLTWLFLGLWLLATPFLGWDAFRDGRHLDAVGVTATAEVLESYRGRQNPWEDVTVALMTPGGRERTSVTGNAFQFYEQGQQLSVEYDPSDVSRARIAGSRSALWSQIAFGLVVAPFVILAAGFRLIYHLLNRVRPLQGRHVSRRE